MSRQSRPLATRGHSKKSSETHAALLSPSILSSAETPLYLEGFSLQASDSIFLAEAEQLQRSFPAEAWARKRRPTRISITRWFGNSDNPACPFPQTLREIRSAIRLSQLSDVVHADILVYEESSSQVAPLLGWHQDSFDARRHLATLVLELVNQTACAVCRRTTRLREKNPILQWRPLVRQTMCKELDCECQPCLLEWAPIEREGESSKLLECESFAGPAHALLSVHGPACNNRLAHRMLFAPIRCTSNGLTPRKRVAAVLFCGSERLKEAAKTIPTQIDMSKWWRPEMND